jgi:hypothetical protein
MDPDPAIFVIDLKMPTKTNLKKVILLITFWRYIYIIFNDKKSKRSFSYCFCLLIEGSDPDPDPEHWLEFIGS